MTEREKIEEALFGKDEDIDDETTRSICQAYGINPSETVENLRQRLAEESAANPEHAGFRMALESIENYQKRKALDGE